MLSLVNLILIPFLMLYEGWVIHLMWGWFVTYTFGVIQPNVLTCVGLSALNSLLFPSAIPSTDTSPEKAFDAILGIFAKVTVVLVTGFVLHFFI